MEDKPTLVTTASGEIEAQQIKAFLESNGIPCTFFGESLRMTHGLTLDGLGRVEIHAAAQDVERAKRLLQAAEAGELSLPEDEDPDPDSGVRPQ
jgi:hypothetical protein